jgi:ribosomal protein S18 acetylase RimI-like enzyme
MNVCDWRDADPADTQWLYAREQDYWVRELAWDASSAWREIEQARVTWGLPGRIAFDRQKTPCGWCYCMPDGDTFHLGGIVAEHARVTAALVDAALAIATAGARPARVSTFVPTRAEGLEAILVERGFACERYHYLARPVARTESGSVEATTWQEELLIPAAVLLQAAYGEGGRHFAPRGLQVEWEHYVRGLVERPGCGVLEPAITRVIKSGDAMQALVLATRLAPGTVHLAQVAVHPERRRAGVARRLVEEACRLAASRGARLVTLLVGESNAAARQLYEQMGFAPRAIFLAGTLSLAEK